MNKEKAKNKDEYILSLETRITPPDTQKQQSDTQS